MGTSITWSGHAWWEDGTAHGVGLCSGPFRTESELRGWTAKMRIEHSGEPGFELSAHRRECTLDEKGDPVANSSVDTSLAVVEDRPTRERHMQLVADCASVLKNANRPLVVRGVKC